MKKILKTVVVAAVACISAIAMSICAFAATEDIELSTTRAKMCPAWGQSITYTPEEMKLAYFTEDTEILIEYETADGAMPDNGYNPVELIFQNYNVEPQIWCQIAPVEFDETSARFVYEDMITQYTGWGGADDLSGINNICFGGTMVGAKVTKVTVTNCEVSEITTTTTAATTEQITEPATEAETTAATTQAEEASAEKDGGVPIVLIVVITVVVAVAIVVTIIILKTRKRFY